MAKIGVIALEQSIFVELESQMTIAIVWHVLAAWEAGGQG